MRAHSSIVCSVALAAVSFKVVDLLLLFNCLMLLPLFVEVLC